MHARSIVLKPCMRTSFHSPNIDSYNFILFDALTHLIAVLRSSIPARTGHGGVTALNWLHGLKVPRRSLARDGQLEVHVS
jgi:hypothetical protein